ncbi:uncharacterized protein LOC115445906 isoform X2 [Manduca sexta]|nr:uncharacterized protein LOC115445906 isoform X2 [Manduca sexta]
MSDEMAVSDNVAGDEDKLNSSDAPESTTEDPQETPAPQPEEEAPPAAILDPTFADDPPPEYEESEEPSEMIENSDFDEKIEDEIVTEKIEKDIDVPEAEVKQEMDSDPVEPADVEDDSTRGVKRKASDAFSDTANEEFKGFVAVDFKPTSEMYSRILDRLEAEVIAAKKDFTPLRQVMATPPPPGRASKRPRKDTDGSRPSSAMSSRSDEATDASGVSTASSPMQRGRRATIEMSSPLLRVPLERGWKRELVFRAALDAHSRRNADIYYYTPKGKKLRSTREVAEHLSGTGLTLENFSFFKEPLGVDDPEKEIIRDAKLIRRVESPVSSPAPVTQVVEGKRTPKPKQPKGASPEPNAKSPPPKIRVKSVGSRLSSAPASPAAVKQAKKPAPSTENNNTAAWKKPSEARRGRLANGAASPPSAAPAPAAAVALVLGVPPVPASPRRRGRPRTDDVDHFTAFYHKAHDSNYNVVVQIFQYLGMRDLAHSARVCKLWRQLAATPALWRHVRMKNSHVSDWGGLCTALKRHGTKRLDLRKMLLPQNDTVFWEQFAQHIGTVDTLERIEMCRCPAAAVEAVCRSLPGLRSLAALAIRDARLDPAPLASLPLLHELRLKSLAGLSLTRDLSDLAALTRLQHLSLTSIKELGWRACEVVGSLPLLESLELGECTFRAEFGAALGRLARLRRLRLERGPAAPAAPPLLRALARLPRLASLELVNVDVKVGFDDALAECTNIQRLLIIPTYVSQSATTNKQVLGGVLRLKDSLTHLMWGVTIELLRVTELFIDQCEQAGDAKKRDVGECIPVLKPVPGCKLPSEHQHVAGPPQVEILPLPTLQRLLSAQLPNTKLKLLRIPFHATWRQSLADFQ